MRRSFISKRSVPALLLFLTMLLLAPSLSSALLYQYSYTGNHFTSATAPYTADNFISIAFTTDQLLTSATTTPDADFNVYHYTISDGIVSREASFPRLGTYITAFGSDGLPTQWQFMYDEYYDSGLPRFLASSSLLGDSSYLQFRTPEGGREYGRGSVETPGLWTITEVPPVTIPESATFVQLAAGLAGMTGMIMIRRRRALH